MSLTATPASTRIRVAHILTSIQEGGLERFVLTLASELPRDQFDVKVYALLRDNPWIEEFRSRGIPVRVLNARNRMGILGLGHNVFALGRLSRWLVADRIDIVHTPDFYPAFMGRMASFLARVPSRVHTLHSVYDWYPDLVFPVQRLLGRGTDLITGVSHAAIAFSKEREGFPEDKYRLVPNGADGNRFRPDPQRCREFREEQGWAVDDIVVGAVGARTPRKGHPLLAQAMAPLMRENPRLRLAILGASGGPVDTRAEVESILGPELADRFHALAPRKDVERAYAAFDIHCMPSEVEGLSFASIEGQLTGCISVFSDLPAFREVSDGGTTALIFRQGDMVDLQRALSLAISMVPSKTAWGQRARDRALEQFSQERMVQSYARIYSQLAAKSRARAGT